MRDPENGVNIDVVLAGEYPGDGEEKPVVFPDPAEAAVRGEREPAVTEEETLNVQRIMNAAYTSAAEGREVAIEE